MYESLLKTMEEMTRHPWPGNVRELENAIERAITLAGESSRLVSKHLLPAGPGHSAVSGSLAEAVASAERERIAAALKATGGKRGDAAKMLGISRKTLWEKVKKHEETLKELSR